jgi:hypothetical protein
VNAVWIIHIFIRLFPKAEVAAPVYITIAALEIDIERAAVLYKSIIHMVAALLIFDIISAISEQFFKGHNKILLSLYFPFKYIKMAAIQLIKFALNAAAAP